MCSCILLPGLSLAEIRDYSPSTRFEKDRTLFLLLFSPLISSVSQFYDDLTSAAPAAQIYHQGQNSQITLKKTKKELSSWCLFPVLTASVSLIMHLESKFKLPSFINKPLWVTTVYQAYLRILDGILIGQFWIRECPLRHKPSVFEESRA